MIGMKKGRTSIVGIRYLSSVFSIPLRSIPSYLEQNGVVIFQETALDIYHLQD